jgi:pyrrolysine biosynthesis protein PylD
MLPDETDVSGIYSACRSEADILFMADEQKYIALSLHGGAACENDMATAYGYACALDAMAGGLESKDVLVIGLGRVGMFAIDALTQLGANISVYDKDKSKYAGIKKNPKIEIAEESDIENTELIYDATNIGAWLSQSRIREDALISAPGIPSSIIGKQDAKLRNRIFHDPLQTGTAVMLAWALAEESY